MRRKNAVISLPVETAMASKNPWTLNGVALNTKQMAAEMKAAVDAANDAGIDAVVTELEDLLKRLNRRSTKRGVGRNASRYNSPLKDAKVIVKRTPGNKTRKATIYVDSDVFNILDAGAPPRNASAGKRMLFPFYGGNLTRQSSFRLKRQRVHQSNPVIWVAVRHVAGFEGRHYYQQVTEKVFKDLGGRPPSEAKGRFKYTLDPDLIELKVIKRK